MDKKGGGMGDRSRAKLSQNPNQKTTLVDNFVVQSRAFLQTLNIDRFPNTYTQGKRDEVQIKPMINGVNYFQNELVFNKDVEVLTDCVAVRGDNFYLKKGDVVRISSIICEYAYIRHRGFKGYFPCSFFKIDYRYKP